MKKLDTHHLVQLFDVVFTSNNAYIIQEYCNQGDLEKLLKSKNHFSENEAKKIIFEIITGYEEMLKVNIIHRDLKLENVFINDGSFKIGKFGK
jgi:serine/threonine protein kinase